MFEALGEGRGVPDHEFDRIFPKDVRDLSEIHWTPIDVARRAAELLVVDSGTRVLDVGSGCGKFCIVGAATTNGRFHGIEQRRSLVNLARMVAENYEVSRVEFTEGDVRSVDWSLYQGFYLFNPFIDNVCSSPNRIDESIDLSEISYFELIHWVQGQLRVLPTGTRVVTYHGFGGEMPPEYRLQIQEPRGGDYLRLWVKVRK